jgi:hypothetical protein
MIVVWHCCPFLKLSSLFSSKIFPHLSSRALQFGMGKHVRDQLNEKLVKWKPDGSGISAIRKFISDSCYNVYAPASIVYVQNAQNSDFGTWAMQWPHPMDGQDGRRRRETEKIFFFFGFISLVPLCLIALYQCSFRPFVTAYQNMAMKNK